MDRRRWKKVARNLVMPRLPGDWVVNDKGMMTRLPIGRVAQIITYDTSTYGGTNWGIWACAHEVWLVLSSRRHLIFMHGMARSRGISSCAVVSSAGTQTMLSGIRGGGGVQRALRRGLRRRRREAARALLKGIERTQRAFFKLPPIR